MATWRAQKGTAARALAALSISARSKPPFSPCTRAQSDSVCAATAARARRWDWLSEGLGCAGCWRLSPPNCLSWRSSSMSRLQWLRAQAPSRTQKMQIAETAATSTSSVSAGRLTSGRRIWSRVPKRAGSRRRSELDQRSRELMIPRTRRQTLSRSVLSQPCSLRSSSSSLSFFLMMSLIRCASMNSSSATAFFFWAARLPRSCTHFSMEVLSPSRRRLRRDVKQPVSSPSPPSPSSGMQRSLTRRITRVLKDASRAWRLPVLAWYPAPRP
mmetsp:Transcript_13643/g.38748  ORF Transcript_13643/g.38748 Transcript_13643/m.38748 type:complete len:271 (+) Transcript_13643:787-1599(+)